MLFSYNNYWQLHASLDYFTKHIDSPFMHLWYISILVQFDLLFPVLFILLKKLEEKFHKNISIFVVGICAIFSTILFFYMSQKQNIMVAYYDTTSRIFSILYGVLLALFLHKFELKPPKKLVKNSRNVFRFYLLLLILFGIFVAADAGNFALTMIITSLISIRLIRYAYLEKNKRRTSLVETVISKISKFSYEIYLVQYPIIFLMQDRFNNTTIKNIVIIVLTFIISYIIHALINKQFVKKQLNILKFTIIRPSNNYRLRYSY